MSKFADWTISMTPVLQKEFGFALEDCWAIFGNAGHESAGFEDQCQGRGTDADGKCIAIGGWQWDGSRKKDYIAFCAAHGYDRDSYEANLGNLIRELKGPESRSVKELKRAVGLRGKSDRFEETFERAGVKAHDSRYRWALKAKAAWEQGRATTPTPPVPLPDETPVPTQPGQVPPVNLPAIETVILPVVAAIGAGWLGGHLLGWW